MLEKPFSGDQARVSECLLYIEKELHLWIGEGKGIEKKNGTTFIKCQPLYRNYCRNYSKLYHLTFITQ